MIWRKKNTFSSPSRKKKKSHLFPALSQFFIMLSYWPFLQQEVLRLSLWGL